MKWCYMLLLVAFGLAHVSCASLAGVEAAMLMNESLGEWTVSAGKVEELEIPNISSIWSEGSTAPPRIRVPRRNRNVSFLQKYTIIDKRVYDFIFDRRSMLPQYLNKVSRLVSSFRESIGLPCGPTYKLSIKKLVFIYYKYCILPLQAGGIPCYEAIHRTGHFPIMRLADSQASRLYSDESIARKNRTYRQYIL